MENKFKLKKFLATASAFAMITSASSAMGAVVATNAAVPALQNGVGLVGLVGGKFVSGADSIKLGGVHNIATAGNVDFAGGIDANANAGVTFTVGHAVTATADIEVAVVLNAGSLNIGANNIGKDATVNSGVLTAADVGNDLIAAGGISNIINVVNDVTITKAAVVNATGAVGNDLNVGGAGLFNGSAAASNIFGAVTINTTNAAANVVHDIAGATVVTKGTLNLNNAKALSINNGGIVNVADTGKITGAVTAPAAGKGVLNFVGAGTAATLVGTAVNALGSINAQGKGNVVLTKDTFATTLNVAHAGADVTLLKNFTGEVQFSLNGLVSAADKSGITGDVKNTSGVDNTGKLVFAANGKVTGAIGEDTKALNLVQVTGAGNVALSGKTHYAETFNFKNNNARLVIADGGKLVGNLTANAVGKGEIEFTKAGEIIGTIGTKAKAFGLVEAKGAGAVTINAGDHHFAFLETKHANASLIIKDGANLTGDINNTSGAVNKTAITFEGSSIVDGTIGGGADTFKNININKAVVTTKGDVVAKNINFIDAKSGGLTINGGAGNQDIGIAKGLIQTAKDSRGEIVIGAAVAANDVTFKSQIGNSADATALALLDIQNNNAGSTVTLAKNSHITKIKAAGASTLSLAGDQKIGSIELAQSAKLALNIAADTKLINANGAGKSADFGTKSATLGAVSFTANDTLTLTDGVNIVASELNTGAANRGTLTFKGASTFDAAVTDGVNRLAAINVNGAKTVRIVKEMKVTGDVTLVAGSTLELGGNIKAANIKGAGANKGTLRFVNAAASTVTGKVGAGGNTLSAIEFDGNNVEFKGKVAHAGGFKFNAKNAMQVTFDAATDVGASNFVNASTGSGVNHTVVLQKDTIFTGKIATATAATNQIIFQLGTKLAPIDAEIGGVDTSGAIFRTTKNDNSNLDFNFNGATVHSVGEVNKELLTVVFTKSGTITNGVFAKDIIVNKGQTASLGGIVGGKNGTNLANAGSTVNFLDGFTLNSAVVTTTANKGVANLGGGYLNKDIATAASRAKTVNFSADATKVLNMNANVFATEANLGKGTVKSVQAVTIDAAAITTAGNTFDTAGGDITLNGTNVTLSNDVKINVVLAQAGNKVTGNQVVTKGDLTVAANTTLVTNIDDTNIVRPRNGATYTYTSLNNEGTVNAASKLLTANVNGTATDKWISWTSEALANGDVVNTGSDNSENAILNALGANADSVDQANIKALAAAADGTDASKFYDGLLRNVFGDKKLDEALERLTTVTTATDAIEGTMGNVSNMLGARVGSLGGIQSAGTPVQSGLVRKTASTSVTGVAAGDDHARYGAWFSPFFSKTTQKARKNAAGYKDTTYGGSFGLDTRANDDLIIGGAFTFADSEMKHSDRKSGDTTKVNSLMLSIYAMQQITDTWFAQGSATVGSNDVKDLERNVAGLTAYDTRSGKYNSMSFTGEALFGYNYATEDLTLTPMAGLRYSRVNSAGYKHTGSTTGQNLDVSQKASNKLDVVFGAKIAGGTFDVNGMSVTPEMHGFINHDLIGKNPIQSQRIGGVSGSLGAKSRKPIKTTYNLGLGVNADYGMMEYGAGYDLNLAEKRVGHEGSLKIRVNF